MSTGPALRLARAVFFAAVCTVTTAGGHVLMSGHGIAPGPLLAVAVVLALCALPATGRELPGRVIAAATVTAQLALHTLFTLLPAAPRPTGAVHGGAAGTAAHHAGHPGPSGYADHAHALGEAGGAALGHGWTPGMVAAHATAALVCALWLWRGEIALFGAVRAGVALLAEPLRLVARARAHGNVPARRPRPGTAAGRGFAPVRTALLRHALSRRGPPPLAVC
ncbi:hypothetical protein GCM10027160_41880 [Streptomyces calidiresistens]|uniref:Integral membrane protein n=1 Tax=Streptomyces calidiresistens TaxID=1485586 RepID=A0A7W3XY98_9ACTN|nr:hypothetical protein [Streptomyces calidiresistens]MBB0231622.1 hypothetical protein [Streptomyces calidiresistens]